MYGKEKLLEQVQMIRSDIDNHSQKESLLCKLYNMNPSLKGFYDWQNEVKRKESKERLIKTLELDYGIK